MPNSNCLIGMRCPKCGSFGPYEISGGCEVEVGDDGTAEAVNFTWDDSTYCRCRKCGNLKKVGDFKENWVVVDGDLPNSDNIAFGAAKRELCEAFIAGREHFEIVEHNLSLHAWETFNAEG